MISAIILISIASGLYFVYRNIKNANARKLRKQEAYLKGRRLSQTLDQSAWDRNAGSDRKHIARNV